MVCLERVRVTGCFHRDRGRKACLSTAAGQGLIALDFLLSPTPEIVILGDPAQPETKATIASLNRRFVPNRVVACRAATGTPHRSRHLDPLFEGKPAVGAGPAIYICQNFTCQAPVSGPAIEEAWKTLGG